MREKIYTIPVNEAFKEECECPMCFLEKKLEDEYVDYILGPSLMESDSRIDTNEKGFCRKHFELLYNRKENKLGLGLIIDTHLGYQKTLLNKICQKSESSIKKDSNISFLERVSLKLQRKQTDTGKMIDEIIESLTCLKNQCTICDKLNNTMDRYIDVILYLWFKEDEFKETFNSKKGFCLEHFRLLLEGAKRYLNSKEAAIFVDKLLEIQLDSLNDVKKDVNWFTKKFDYRYKDASWENSKDALPRCIQKITGRCDLN